MKIKLPTDSVTTTTTATTATSTTTTSSATTATTTTTTTIAAAELISQLLSVFIYYLVKSKTCFKTQLRIL